MTADGFASDAYLLSDAALSQTPRHPPLAPTKLAPTHPTPRTFVCKVGLPTFLALPRSKTASHPVALGLSLSITVSHVYVCQNSTAHVK